MSNPFHIAIVGGGFAGLAAALALDEIPQAKITLFAPDFHQKAHEDGRATAIAFGPRQMLAYLGVWQALQPQAGEVRKMAIGDGMVEDGVIPPILNFESGAHEDGAPLSHIVPNHALIKALKEKVAQRAGIELCLEKVIRFENGDDAATLHLEGGKSRKFDLVIAADGARSSLRKDAGIKTVNWPYGQMGLVADVRHSVPHDGVAYQNFLPGGPIASLPLADANRSSLVWTGEEAAHKKRLKNRAALEDDLREALPSMLGSLEEVRGVNAYPLHFLLAREFAEKRLALVGDAAHAIHPLAGQGLNLGFKDVAALAQALSDSLSLGLDPIFDEALTRYGRARRFEVTSVVMACDGLNRLFRKDGFGLRTLRDFGLGLVERAPFLKKAFASEAKMGSENLRLMRGLPLN